MPKQTEEVVQEFLKLVEEQADLLQETNRKIKDNAMSFHARVCISPPEDKKACEEQFVRTFMEHFKFVIDGRLGARSTFIFRSNSREFHM